MPLARLKKRQKLLKISPKQTPEENDVTTRTSKFSFGSFIEFEKSEPCQGHQPTKEERSLKDLSGLTSMVREVSDA